MRDCAFGLWTVLGRGSASSGGQSSATTRSTPDDIQLWRFNARSKVWSKAALAVSYSAGVILPCFFSISSWNSSSLRASSTIDDFAEVDGIEAGAVDTGGVVTGRVPPA